MVASIKSRGVQSRGDSLVNNDVAPIRFSSWFAGPSANCERVSHCTRHHTKRSNRDRWGLGPAGIFFCHSPGLWTCCMPRTRKNEATGAKRLMRVRETGVAECGEKGALQKDRTGCPCRSPLTLKGEKGERGGYEVSQFPGIILLSNPTSVFPVPFLWIWETLLLFGGCSVWNI